MKNTSPPAVRRSDTPPSTGLRWSIRSETIPCMQSSQSPLGVDASAGCMNDCGGITRLPRPRSTRPPRGAR